MQKKITLHLKHLLDNKLITEKEANRLIALSENKASGFIFRNLMVIFGVLSIVSGFLGLAPDPNIAALLASLILGAGYLLNYKYAESWKFVAQSFGFLGTIGICAWLIYTMNTSDLNTSADKITTWLIISALIGTVSFTIHNKFLAALLPLTLAQLIGAATFYSHASYYISIREPSIAIIMFGTIAAATYFASTKLKGIYDDLCTIIARVSIFIVHMAFWIGSLWGDRILQKPYRWGDTSPPMLDISETYFSIGWAIVLLVSIAWGAKRGLGYLANLSIVFLGIHFYTQYFETVGASPLGLLIGGLLIFSSSMLWWKYRETLEAFIAKLSK